MSPIDPINSVHNRNWQKYSTHRLEAEAFAIKRDLTQLVQELTRIPDSKHHFPFFFIQINT